MIKLNGSILIIWIHISYVLFKSFSDDEDSEPAESISGKADSSRTTRHWTQVEQK